MSYKMGGKIGKVMAAGMAADLAHKYQKDQKSNQPSSGSHFGNQPSSGSHFGSSGNSGVLKSIIHRPRRTRLSPLPRAIGFLKKIFHFNFTSAKLKNFAPAEIV